MYIGAMVQGRRKWVSYKLNILVDVLENQWYRAEGTREPIIDRETFAAVQ